MVYIRYFLQGNHHTYGHIWCRYTVLANPMQHKVSVRLINLGLIWLLVMRAIGL